LSFNLFRDLPFLLEVKLELISEDMALLQLKIAGIADCIILFFSFHGILNVHCAT